MKNLKLFLLTICYSTSLIGSLAQNPNQEATHSITLDTTVHYGKLENGFTYYLKKNQNPDKKIVLKLIVKSGYGFEEKDQLQYAHLLEHLVAKQTRSFSNVNTYFSNVGGFSNAQTGGTYTIYEATITSLDKQVLKNGLKILYEWSQGNKWTPEFISIERAAILGEMRTSDPYRLWLRRNREMQLLQGNGIRFYDEKKHRASIKNFNYSALQRFYKDWYRPNLQAAVIVGDINTDSLETEIKQIFSRLKNPISAKNAKQPVVTFKLPYEEKNQFSTVIDSIHPELKLEIIRKGPNFELEAKTSTDYKNMLLQQLYEGILNERSKRLEAQYDPPFAYFAPNHSLGQFPLSRLKSTLMRLALREGELKQLKNWFQKGIIAWKKLHFGLNKIELAKAKEELYKSYTDDQLLTSEYLARRIQKHFIYGRAAPSIKIESKLVSVILDQINVKDMREYFCENGDLSKNTNFIFFKGNNKDIPKYEVFQQWINEVDTMNIDPLTAPEEKIVSLEDVVKLSRSKRLDKFQIQENLIGVTTVVLPNNVKLIFKPTDPSKNQFENTVAIKAFRPNPVPLNNKWEYLIGQVSPEVLQYSGAGSYTKFELDRFMQDQGIKLRLHADKNHQLISGESKVEDIPEFLSLLYLYFVEPRQDLQAFKAWKTSRMKGLEGKQIRGSTAFIRNRIESLWYPEVPVLKVQDLMQLQMEEVFQVSKRWFSDIGGFTFVLTGDFDTVNLLPALANTLTGFPLGDNRTFSKEKLVFPLKKMKKKLEFKNINQVYARLFFPVKPSRDLKTQIELKLLSQALHQRIFERLRKGCYAPSARGEWMDVKNEVYAFQIEFDSALGNEETLLKYAIEEFRKLKNYGVDQQWLDIAIKNELQSYERRFSSFGYFNFWPDYLKKKLVVKENVMQEVLEYGTILEHFITLEDLNTAAKRYMTEEYRQEFLGYPEGYKPI